MLPTQPEIQTRAYVQQFGGWRSRDALSFSSETVRMGEIYDWLIADYAKFPCAGDKIVIEGVDWERCIGVETGWEMMATTIL